jgi:hypothetical protein
VQRAILSLVLLLLAGACSDAATPPKASDPTDASSDATDILEVSCDGETTELLTSSVRAAQDGVHVLVNNLSDGRLSMEWPNSGGEDVDPGATTMVADVPPGSSRVRCVTTGEAMYPEEGDWSDFEVLAPEGWVSPTLDCPIQYRGIKDYGLGARGVADPFANASKHFREEGDRVVQAGYATPEERTFVLLLEEQVIAGLTYRSDGHDGWLQAESFGCSD